MAYKLIETSQKTFKLVDETNYIMTQATNYSFYKVLHIVYIAFDLSTLTLTIKE